MNSPTPAIQIENLTYAYGRAEAVHDLSLTVEPGRCYGLFGRNGAGKTTTMKCLLNLLRPQRGQVRVFGLDPAKHEVEVKRLALLRAGPGGVLSVDERSRDAGLPRFISRAIGTGRSSRSCSSVSSSIRRSAPEVSRRASGPRWR